MENITMTISFDGKEAIVSNPSDRLRRDIDSVGVQRWVYLETDNNCSSIVVTPSRHAGKIVSMKILRDSITAVRFAVPTS